MKTNDDSIHDRNDAYTWNDAGNFIAALNDARFGGYTDWRMPSIQELSFLGDFSIPDPGPIMPPCISRTRNLVVIGPKPVVPLLPETNAWPFNFYTGFGGAPEKT